MTNREKFKDVFGKDIKWSEAIQPQMLALKSAQINGIDCMEEWLNAEYKEPTTKNNLGVDAISREDAIRVASGYCHPSNVAKELAKLPPVTPIRPKGHWIWEIDETPSTPVSSYELNYAGWVCSCCHEFPDDICEWDNPDEPPTYKFCPNCGSDNREVEE